MKTFNELVEKAIAASKSVKDVKGDIKKLANGITELSQSVQRLADALHKVALAVKAHDMVLNEVLEVQDFLLQNAQGPVEVEKVDEKVITVDKSKLN